MVTLVTCDDTNDMWSHLSHVGKLVTVVTCGHTMSKFSHVSKKTDEKKSALIDLTAAPKVKNSLVDSWFLDFRACLNMYRDFESNKD